MDTTGIRDSWEKVVNIVEGLPGDHKDSLFLSIDNQYTLSIGFFPSKENKEEAVRYALSICGKMEKDSDGTMVGQTQGVRLVLHSVLSCKIVSYKKVKKEKVIYTGKYEMVDEPVYECISPLVKGEVQLSSEEESIIEDSQAHLEK